MNWKKNNVNIAIQVLPEAEGKNKYDLVDAAIAAIQESGFRYKVCPFETVIECTYADLPVLMENIHAACKKAGTQKMLMNMKLQVNFMEDVSIEDKMEKYE